jgi:hypothetical protein
MRVAPEPVERVCPWVVSDEISSLIEPLLPEPGPKLVEERPGSTCPRNRVSDPA